MGNKTNHKTDRVKKNCLICGEEFYVQNYRNNTAKYCSRSCKSKGVYQKAIEGGLRCFERGNTPWNKGKKTPDYIRKKLSEAHKGHKAWNAGTADLLKRRLNNSLKAAISRSVKGNKKGRHWESMVGWQLSDLMIHLEKKFKHGMTWENYGEWHIDHKIPIAAFNFNAAEDFDFKRCWSLNNLQPLWASENLRKNDNLTKPFQPTLLLRESDAALIGAYAVEEFGG